MKREAGHAGSWQGAWAWLLYAPVGLKYLLLAGLLAAGIRQLLKQPQAPRPSDRHLLPPALAAAALVAWLCTSALWSDAPLARQAAWAGLYAVVLVVPLLAATLPAAAARSALDHFARASGAVGALFVAAAAGVSVPWLLGASTVHASGNLRISTSILLAVGACLALARALHQKSPMGRLGWAAVAALAGAGLALQDRRSGLLVLPVVLSLWAVTRPVRGRTRAVGLVLVVCASTLAWYSFDGVRARFAEGMRELSVRQADAVVDTSWGQRLRMQELTLDMIAERPFAGSGLASWTDAWARRTPPGSMLASNTTPHNEYLLLAQQGGLPAAALLAVWLGLLMRLALKAGPDGVALLVVAGAFFTAAAFNAVLRDARFALPLVVLAGLAGASARGTLEDRGPFVPVRPR